MSSKFAIDFVPHQVFYTRSQGQVYIGRYWGHVAINVSVYGGLMK